VSQGQVQSRLGTKSRQVTPPDVIHKSGGELASAREKLSVATALGL